MRFGQSKRPINGAHQVFHRFLWLPITLGGETRWLEWAKIKYCYHREPCGDFWEPINFVNP